MAAVDNGGKSTGGGIFRLKTASGKYLCARPKASSRKQPTTSGSDSAPLPPLPDIRGDAAAAAAAADDDDVDDDETTHVRIRMQARFKPRLRADKEERAREKVSRRELEQAVGRRLEDDEVRRLKRARKEGDYHEQLLRLKVKGKHDKYG